MKEASTYFFRWYIQFAPIQIIFTMRMVYTDI